MPPFQTMKVSFDEEHAISRLREYSIPFQKENDIQALVDHVGNSQIVLLGEASHGTHEYYTWRSLITKKLIREKGFRFIAVEGDWPDCYQLNRYIKNYSFAGKTSYEVLEQFNRWPTWMWANWEMVAFSEWLYDHNKDQPIEGKTGFYGLDVYSLWESMHRIIQYLKQIDPHAVEIAERALQCFEPYYPEGTAYAKASQMVPELCKDEVLELLKKILERMPRYNSDQENVLNLQQNAHVAYNAERYFRAMIMGGPHAWNIRDSHMADTLDRLLHFHGHGTKAIIWAHNTHVGDARATDMTSEGLLNLGELVRLKHHEKGVSIIGFGAYSGEVIAAPRWEAKMQKITMPPARKGSWEYLLHKAGSGNRFLLMQDFLEFQFMENPLDHRAIGVVYNPEYEKYSNYVPSYIPLRYDAFMFFDHTHALHPLHIQPDGNQIPETYPFGV